LNIEHWASDIEYLLLNRWLGVFNAQQSIRKVQYSIQGHMAEG
jgi:hypothetical protein